MQPSNRTARQVGERAAIEPWLGVMAASCAAAAYLSVNFALPLLLPASINVYVAQPLLWSYLAVTIFLGWKYGVRNKPRMTGALLLMAVLAGAFQIAVFVIAGVFFGFGYSPYGHRWPMLLGNLVYVVSMLLAVEMGRACIVSTLGKRRPLLAVVLPSLFFCVLSLPAGTVTSQSDVIAFFRVTGETILPRITENLLASFLAIVGGPGVSIAYRGTLQAFEWLSPVLPDLPWTVTAFLGTMIPASALLVIQRPILPGSAGPVAARPQVAHASNAWLLIAAMTAALVWFDTGLFGVRPTLVSGVSMSPAFVAGDLAIIRDVPADDVKVGDIIRFRRGETYILHRVVAIKRDEIGALFITRGDANNVDDPPVPASALGGKLILIIPKVGWVGIGVRRLIESLR